MPSFYLNHINHHRFAVLFKFLHVSLDQNQRDKFIWNISF